MQTTDNGSYLEIDDRPAVRFERVYDHPVTRVWEAISDPAQMSQWFPSPQIEHDAREGGSITLSGDPYAPEAKTTRVLVWDPPHRFSFGWGDDELHFTLTEVEEGTRLELVNILATSGAASRNAAGWEMCLEHLDQTVAGTWQASPSDGDLEDFWPVLDKYLALGLPDDGWRPEQPGS